MSACPYLGLSDDPSLMLSEPSPAHRCLAVRPHKSPNEAYQASHCLLAEHVRCQYYVSAQADPGRKRVATASGRRREKSGSKAGSFFPAFLGILLLGALVTVAVMGASGRAPGLLSMIGFGGAADDAQLAAAGAAVSAGAAGDATSEETPAGGETPAESAAADQGADQGAEPATRPVRTDDEQNATSLEPSGLAVAAGTQNAAGAASTAAAATDAPTAAATDAPTDEPTDEPTAVATRALAEVPTEAPTSAPTEAPISAPTSAPTTAPTDTPTDTPTSAATRAAAATPTNEPASATPAPANTTPTPTANPALVLAATDAASGAAADTTAAAAAADAAATTELRLAPRPSDVGWWSSSEAQPGEVGDSFLYAGRLGEATFLSAAHFDLSRIPRGAPILAGALELTGLSDARLNRSDPTLFRVQLVAERELASLAGADFMSIFSAPASITSLRDIPAGELQVGTANSWPLDENILGWLEQELLDGAKSFTLRISTAGETAGDTLFAWDSGIGQKSTGEGPALLLTVGAAPPTPPLLPTRDYLVATFTPVPLNVETAVALQQTATHVAQTVGTFTPVPAFVTPTPQPTNLATLQANALAQGLLPVVQHTPTPANAAIAAAQVARSTAVAQTTGTYTPVPADYVTPFVVIPSPPAQNTATAVARQLEADLAAMSLLETPTPLPYNAIVGDWITATPTPASGPTATTIALAVAAEVSQFGPATATPFHWLVITATPTPVPTSTPTVKPVIFESEFTPTPVPTATEFIPATMPEEYRNLIFFKRGGPQGETWVVNPDTSESGLVTRDWLYPLAQKSMPYSPDGKAMVFVRSNNAGTAEIYIRNLESGRETKITNFNRPSYDPTWSPTGEWIAFVTSNTGNDEIFLITPDGSILKQLTFNNWEWDKHPSWSPDGSRLTFFSNRGSGNTQIWTMNVDGSNQKRLLESESEDMYPVWAR